MRYGLLGLCLLTLLPMTAQAQTGIGGRSLETPPPAPNPAATIWRGDNLVNDAEALMRQGKYVDALTPLDQAIARNIRNADAHVDTAMIWLNLGNLDKARAATTNALSIDKGHLGAYIASGLLALKENNLQQATAFLSALRVLCRGEQCAEFQFLQKTIRESGVK